MLTAVARYSFYRTLYDIKDMLGKTLLDIEQGRRLNNILQRYRNNSIKCKRDFSWEIPCIQDVLFNDVKD